MPGLKRTLPGADEESHASAAAAHAAGQRSESKRIRVSGQADDDGRSDEETDEEIQTQQATQFHEKQKSRNLGENGPAENGIIECVTLVNFMCHTFLKVDIGPLINFIIGHNGSGKSAVLTALTVCLGGKASATNRASSLKSFIKEGAESSMLSVRIKNGGDDGYQQELYGDSIIVERSFSRSGTSTFKIKSARGNIISTKRSDLEDISDYYALQLDNPINVLTQDMSRQFLSNSGPTEKYKFFIRGVQLEQLNRDYDLLHDNICQMEATFEDKRLHVEQLRERKDRAKATFDLLGRNENIISKMQFVRSQLAWCQVEEQEGQLRQAEESLVTIEGKLEILQAQVAESGERLTNAEQTRDQAKDDEAKALEESEKVSGELIAAREGQEAFKEEALNAQRDERSIDEEISSIRRAMDKTKAEIRAEMSRLEEVNGGSIARHLEQLEEKKEAVESARRLHRDHGARRDDILKEQNDMREELQHSESRKRAKHEERASCEQRIRNLRNQGEQREFKPNMDRLIKAVATSKDFREKPIGPIGNYIRLTDPQWLSILERSFGDVLEAFIVTSKADQARLTDLMRRVQCQTSVVIGSQAAIDTSRHEPDPELTTVLRVLRIEKEIVKRQLVINQSIEQTILIPSVQRARELMDRTRLPNVKQCYSHQPSRPNAGERFSYGLGGALNSSFIPPWAKRPRMRTVAEDSIAFEQNQLQRLDEEAREISEEMGQLNSRVLACKRKLDQHDRQERSLKADIQRAQHLCDETQEKIDADSIEEGKLDALKQTLIDAEQELTHNEQVRSDAVKEKEKHTGKWKAMEPDIRAIEGRRRAHDAQLKRAKDHTRKMEETRQNVLFQKNKLHDELEQLRSDQTVTAQDKAELTQLVQNFSDAASGIGPRVQIDSGENDESLRAKLQKLEEERRNHERRVEKITKDYETATTRFAEAYAHVEQEEKLVQLLRQTLNDREERWKLFRQKISARARATFVFVLSERSFHGHLKINHGQRKLEIAVQPDATQRDRSGREASSLSGGEKSYSTICLLLSLWDAVGAPIRCLDEFDVYMDNVNREISMKLLVRAARNAAGRQFILISPQAGILEPAPDVKIIKLRDPERNQGRLTQGAQMQTVDA